MFKTNECNTGIIEKLNTLLHQWGCVLFIYPFNKLCWLIPGIGFMLKMENASNKHTYLGQQPSKLHHFRPPGSYLCQHSSQRAASGAVVYPTGREERDRVRAAGTEALGHAWGTEHGCCRHPNASEVVSHCPLATRCLRLSDTQMALSLMNKHLHLIGVLFSLLKKILWNSLEIHLLQKVTLSLCLSH